MSEQTNNVASEQTNKALEVKLTWQQWYSRNTKKMPAFHIVSIDPMNCRTAWVK